MRLPAGCYGAILSVILASLGSGLAHGAGMMYWADPGREKIHRSELTGVNPEVVIQFLPGDAAWDLGSGRS